MNCWKIISCTLLIALNVISAQGQSYMDNADMYIASIEKTLGNIHLDGILNEKDWQKASWSTNFWTKFPEVRAGAYPRTEVALAFDDENLFVAVKCYTDKAYVIQTLKRDKDFFSSDAFGFVVDPVNQKTNGYMFGVNALGVRSDAIITTNSRDAYEPDWDNKWFSKVVQHSDHWTAEFAIPFKTLRYEANSTEWGINFIRNHISDNEYHTWAPVPMQFQEVNLGYLGTLKWREAPDPIKGNITLIPYSSASIIQSADDPDIQELEFGLDAKIALSSSLNLDFTVNPDFSQIEVDEQITNLTRFNIRLPEKRTFFLENDDIFSNFGSFNARPFFSRRLGLNDEGEAVPINYGLRLSGNINESIRLGFFNAQQQALNEDPSQNFTAFAIHKKIFDRSNIRAFLTNRQAWINQKFDSDDYGRNAGLEYTYISKDGQLEYWAGWNKSIKKGFNTEDQLFKYGVRFNSRTLRLMFRATNRGTNYYTDMGFSSNIINYDAVRDIDIRLGANQYYLEGMYSIFPKAGGTVNRHRFGAENYYVINTDGELSENIARLKYFIDFNNQSQFQVRLNDYLVNLRFPFAFTSEEPLPAKKYHFQSLRVNFTSDTKRKLVYNASMEMGSFYSGHKSTFAGSLRYRLQPWGNFEVKMEFNELDFDLFGTSKLYRIIPRIEVSFSKEFFWTTFIQYNTLSEIFGVNSRIQWRFRPMSDLFLVFTDNRDTPQFNFNSRAVTLKLNYWINP